MAKVDAAKLKVIAKNHGLNEVHEAAIELERLRNQNGRLKVTIKKKDHVIRTIDHHNNRLNNDNVAKKSALESFYDKHDKLNIFLKERVSVGLNEHVVIVAMQHIYTVEEENKRLREALDASEKHLMVAERHLRDFKKFEFEERTEKERLREALEFYADEKRYYAWNDDGASDLDIDKGSTARKALGGE